MIFEKVCALIAEQFNVDADSITMDTSFEDDLNADSVDIVDLSMALEEEFDIDELTEEEASSIKSVGDLVRFLQNKRHTSQNSANRRSFACLSNQRTRSGSDDHIGRKAGL